MKRAYLFVIFAVFLLSSCEKRRLPSTPPWGEEIGEDSSSLTAHPASISALQAAGELIVLTVSGPDTYYEQRGRGMGTQYLLAEDFARTIGVGIRVELCRDTTEMLTRLVRGDGDLVACLITSSSPSGRSGGAFLPAGYHSGDTGASWQVRSEAKELAEALDSWYRPEKVAAVRQREDRYLTQRLIPRSSTVNRQPLSPGHISHYDGLFRRYAAVCHADWRLLAAIACQESGFDAQATSWAGACGLMQLMPATAARLGISRSQIYDPETNIAGAARLLAQLRQSYADIPSADERVSFVLASYNAGSGHVRDAMALARKYGHPSTRWADVAPYVLKLSDSQYYLDPVVKNGYMRGTETCHYVSAVRSRWARYGGSGAAPFQPSSAASNTPHRSTKNHRFRP